MALDWERQEELESMALHWGAVRFKRRCRAAVEQGDATRVGAARRLLLDAVSATEEYLVAYLEESRRGRVHTARKWVELVGPEVAAYLTCKVILGNVGLRVPISDTARKITELVLDEVRCRRFRELAPGLFAYRMASFQTSSMVHMARSISGTMKRAQCTACRDEGREGCPHLDTTDLVLPQDQRILVGTFLIRAFMEALPGWMERETVNRHTRPGSRKSKVRRESVLVTTEKAAEWMQARNEILAELNPAALPMVVPPLPWAPGGSPGGYRFGLLAKYPLVRATRYHQALVDSSALPLVYEAVNRIQETPWRVNSEVWEVMCRIEEAGGGIAGLPSFEPVPLPRRPRELDKPEVDPDVLRAWKLRKTQALAKERDRQAEVRRWVNLRTVVREVVDEAAIWFPHNLDFRGRVYPIPTFLTPQGDDRSKGLLEFADGVPLGEEGRFWLAVHGANCLGVTPGGEKVSKWTLQERVEWIEAHAARIRGTALAPAGDLWWIEADKPWQFLAFCFEWRKALIEGPEYVSHLPVSVDGACNGLQHFAGMLRDRAGAKAVNVWPNERPEDVYDRVAQVVLDLLQADAGQGEDYAVRWLASGLVGRSLCKRPTMTFGYGSRVFGFTDQLISYLRLEVPGWPQLQDEHFTAGEEGDERYPVYKQACSYLAGLIWKALDEVVPGAFAAMTWMQESARTLAKGGKAVKWTVPETDFPVVQDQTRYFEADVQRVETALAGGVKYRPTYREKKPRSPDLVKQANAVAPNVVHSLDAACLMKTVAMASHDGIEHFAMVHDSFGTHAANMPVLLTATRQAFFHLYSRHDVVEELYHEWLDQAQDPAALEPPPELGSLDVSVVLASDYFFS